MAPITTRGMEVNSMKRYGAMVLMLTMSAAMGLSGCNTANKVKKTLALNDLHIRAAVAEDEGDWDQAYELWSEYVDRRPQSALAEYRLGLVEMRLGLYEQAAGHLRVAYDLQPGNIEYLEALSEAYVALGEQELLLTLLRQTANEGPDGSGYLRMGRYAQRAGLLDEAKEALDLAIVNGRGQSAEPYMAMADFANEIGDTDLEVRNLRYALWYDRDSVVINERLRGMGMIPGPSLALKPEF
ncbi:MAG: tetratricopeptide repeat protein [Phycisphaerales bacterium]